MEKYAIIMAGGTGSRLWPLSREEKPKQFISADGSKCMLVQTLERISQVVPYENCYVITNQSLKEITRNTLNNIIPDSNIIMEPLRKNTAACIAYSVLFLKNKIKNGVLCFFPADGYVKDETAYRTAVGQAYEAAENSSGLVIIGIQPTYPATGYGYIHADTANENNHYPVINFVEKPDLETAKNFLASGNYWWNSGMVAGNLEAFANHIEAFLPEHYREFFTVAHSPDGQDIFASVKKAYADIPNISFDKGVLERSNDILAIKGVFDWDDIGNLESLSITISPDADGNKVKGKFIGIDTRNSVVYSDKALAAAIGIDNMVIAVTDDTVLVCPKDRVQDIKLLVEQLKGCGLEKYL